MIAVIVDTNVAVVANGRSEQASEACVETCIDRLLQIDSGEVNPPILQAVDSRWLDFDTALRQNGVIVAFICKDDIQGLQTI